MRKCDPKFFCLLLHSNHSILIFCIPLQRNVVGLGVQSPFRLHLDIKFSSPGLIQVPLSQLYCTWDPNMFSDKVRLVRGTSGGGGHLTPEVKFVKCFCNCLLVEQQNVDNTCATPTTDEEHL